MNNAASADLHSSAENLLHAFKQTLQQHLDADTPLYVAYSGGLDSTVLLHLCSQTKHSIHAIHVNHQLQPYASDWAAHCQLTCQQLGVPYSESLITWENAQAPTRNIEAQAREQRYLIFSQKIPANGLLLTAHHLNDQTETFLLRMLRGAGSLGLSAMNEYQHAYGISMLRPLLSQKKAALKAYAKHHDLQWVEDPSNHETHYDRNYLRQSVLPQIKHKWPAIDDVLTRTAAIQRENQQVITLLLDQQWGKHIDLAEKRLHRDDLKQQEKPIQRAVLRHFLSACEADTMPSQAQLERMISDALMAKSDASPIISWGGQQLRAYRHHLYYLPQPPQSYKDVQLSWDGQTDLVFKQRCIISPAQLTSQQNALINASTMAIVRFRQGGEKVVINGQHKSVKHIMQEAGVPPWERDNIPLVYIDGALAFIALPHSQR